jgi:hypothetical protein
MKINIDLVFIHKCSSQTGVGFNKEFKNGGLGS